MTARDKAVNPFYWTLAGFCEDELLPFVFADAEDERARYTMLIGQVAARLKRDAVKTGNDGAEWCVRCFRADAGQPDFASSHVCEDIASGGRRWVRKDLAPDIRRQTAIDEAMGDGARTSAAGTKIRARRA